MDQIDSQLADQCSTIAAAANDAAGWVDDNRAVIGAKSRGLYRELRQCAESANRESRAARRPLCIGIFGPSQVGKSYLVSALTRKDSRPLVALFDREYDFLKEIGPEKNQEATGLVTRFTIHPTGAPRTHPVAVRLLSHIDLVKILANTYFLDFKPTAERELSANEINEALAQARARTQVTPGDSYAGIDTEVENLRLYCKAHFGARKTIESLDGGYWGQLEELSPGLSSQDRTTLFSFLWGKLPELTRIYTELYRALEGLGFAEEAYCKIDALVPKDKSILDVDTLKEITSPTGVVEVLGQNRKPYKLPRAYLTAIVAELLVQIKDQPRDYSAFTDILDFPGARSRKQYDLGGGTIDDLFLRGKVGFLFDRYCEERELTTMLLCMQPGNQEVQSLPDMILDWIQSSHGWTAEERAKKHTALFFVFTKSDRRFEVSSGTEDQTDDEMEEVWGAAVKTALIDFYGTGKDPWPKKWHPGLPFNNCFWLRSPDFRAYHLMNYDANGRETAVRDPARIERYHRAYLASAIVQRHFADPEAAWSALFTLNDGGAKYLSDAIAPICKPELKREQISARLEKLRRELIDKLSEFNVGDDHAAEKKRVDAVLKAADSLSEVAFAQRFGHLLRELQVDGAILYSLFNRTKRSRDSEVSDGPRPKINIRSLLGLNAGKEPNGKAEVRTRFTDLAGLAMAHWADKLQSLPRQSQVLNFIQVEPETIEIVTRELLVGSERMSLENEIVRQMRETKPAPDETLTLAMASAEKINQFVWALGEDMLELSDRATRSDSGRTQPVFVDSDPIDTIETLPKEDEAYLQPFIADWLISLVHLATLNARSGKNQRFSPEQSGRLSDIVQRLDL
jgi:hypothetical protein